MCSLSAIRRIVLALSCASILCLNGCTDPNNPPVAKKQDAKQEPVLNRFTQDVGEFDPNDDSVTVSDGKMKDPHPLNPLGAMNAYGPTLEKISGLGIKRTLEMFRATHGRYPKDHKEFMDKVIKGYDIQLPMLPGGATYKYDTENHELVVVKPKKD